MIDEAKNLEDRREVHLRDYWRLIWRGRWTIVSIFVVVMTLVALGTFTQKKIYRAEATVEISSQSRKVTPMADFAEPGLGNYGWSAEERYYNTQYEIIKSRDVARRVFDRLDLENHPVFSLSADPVGAFAARLNVQPLPETGIVIISMEGADPQEIASWVNTTAEAYVDRNLQQGIEVAANAVKALLDEIKPLKERLENSQRDSFEFAEKTNMFVPENQQTITNERLSTLQTELTQARMKQAEIDGELRQIDELQLVGGDYENIPAISGDTAIKSLSHDRVVLEREYERLLVTYRDRHTRVLEKRSEIDNIKEKIDAEAERIISNLRAQDALLKDRQSKLETAINDAREESLRVNRKATGFEQVRDETAEMKRIHDLISTRVKEITLSASLMGNNLQVLDRATPPHRPIKPRTLVNLGIGALLAFLLGVGAVFFLDYLDNTIRSAEDIEQFLKLNLLALVPKERLSTGSAVNEAYQTLRTGLLFSRKTRDANAVLITSAGPQEGKSCTTVNVATVLAKSGERTIVIDCDLRRPTIHQRMNLDRNYGLTNFILSADGEDWRKFVKQCSHPNLYAMTCGPLPPNPADVFGHEKFRSLLSELKQQFDWVFIDSPPVMSLADATILASMADMVAFVIKHNATDKDLVRRSINSLRRVNPAIVGAVLNNVDLDRAQYRDYYAGYYYEDSAKKKSRKRKNDATVTSLFDTGSDNVRNRFVG